MLKKDLSYFSSQFKRYVYQSKGSGRDFCEQLIQQINTSSQTLLIDTICDELAISFKNSSSQVVNGATYILNKLARSGVQSIDLRMAQRDFQQSLMVTLRGKTSYFGNKLTLHPLLWVEIENRVLSLYEYWFRKFQDDQRFHNMLQKYRQLKSLNIAFPLEDADSPRKPREMQRVSSSEPVVEFEAISNKQFEAVDQLIKKYEQIIERGQINVILTTQQVRFLKGKVNNLYTIFNSHKMPEPVKQRVKKQYSALRNILKKLDLANQKNQITQSQRKYVEQKVKAISAKSLPSPTKANLLEEDSNIQIVATKQSKQQELDDVLLQIGDKKSPTKPQPLRNLIQQQQFTEYQTTQPTPQVQPTPPPPAPSPGPSLLFQVVEKQSELLKQKELEQKQNVLIDTEPTQPKAQPLKGIPDELQL